MWESEHVPWERRVPLPWFPLTAPSRGCTSVLPWESPVLHWAARCAARGNLLISKSELASETHVFTDLPSVSMGTRSTAPRFTNAHVPDKAQGQPAHSFLCTRSPL